MNSPKKKSYQPIISVNDYDRMDSTFYPDRSDAKSISISKSISIGKSLYDNKQISLKVWHKTGGKVGIQRDELPVHRNLDLSILFLSSLLTKEKVTEHFPKSILGEEIDSQAGIHDINEYYKNNKMLIDLRLKELKRLIKEVIK